MKKTTIKRRKRVIPAAGGSPEAETLTERTSSPSPAAEVVPERGSINPDGSVNLGLRRQREPAMALVPETVLMQGRQNSPMFGDLGQYHSSSSQARHDPGSLTADNRLAPLTSLNVSDDHQTSLSPSSFLSPSRKRSFSNIETDVSSQGEGENSKRLSSISSILNPTAEPRLSPDFFPAMRSPGSVATSAPSPGAYSNTGPGATPPPLPPLYPGPKEPSSDNKSKAERRAVLAREAEMIKELLVAKERELAELEEAELGTVI